jgi:hypothetical protein
MSFEGKHRMRVFVIRYTAGCLTICFLMLFPITLDASVVNTHHDFSTSGWTNGETCIICHTPHNANTTVPQSQLWNHDVTNNSFTLYSSSTMDATTTQPTGITRLCLSCHDGTVALDSFGGNTGTAFIRDQTGRNVPIKIGGALNRHHPVAIRYDGALASQDPGLNNPDTTPSGLGGTISSDLLSGGVLECSSCHDVHVSRGTGNCTDCHDFSYPSYYLNTKSLVKSNLGSALCFTCHKK